MANDNKTVAAIVKRVRRECNSLPLPNAAGEKLKLVREINDANKREIAAKDEEIEKLKFEIMHLKSVQRTSGEVIIEQTNKVEAKDAEIAELNKKIYEYEKLLASSPIGLIYQLGICNQDGDVMDGIGLLFTNEAEKAKMPRVGHGDKFYVVPYKEK